MREDASAPEGPDANPSPDDVLLFGAGENLFALEAAGVDEVLPMPRLTPLPGTGRAVRGLFTHRGELIVAADAAVVLGEPRHPPGASARLLVLRQGRQVTGLLVDRVAGIVRLAPGEDSWEGTPVRRLELAQFLKEMDARLCERA